MKTCPNCKKEYADSVAFCLDDGTVLESSEKPSEAETVALPATEVPHAAETIDRFATSVAENFDRDTKIVETGAETAVDGLSPTVLSQTDDLIDDDYAENPMLGWLLPLIIVLILIILGYLFCSKPAAPATITIIINN